MPSSIIITAPHSLCDPSIPYRNCDTATLAAALRLLNVLKDYPIKYFPSPYHRSQIDLNRPIATNTKYYQQIRKEYPNAKLLIDVHSFPKDGFSTDVDMVVLDNVPGTWYGKALYETLANNDISVAHLPGSEINAITQEARQAGIPAILIEYGEFLTCNEIDRINQIIKLWVDQMMQS